VRYLSPLPKNIEAILRNYNKILIPEMNMGQLSVLIRDKFLIDTIGLNKVQGAPFTKGDIKKKALEILN
jgi:2-oxoglutarate ferredoxin oxidoreductase subunit alpha